MFNNFPALEWRVPRAVPIPVPPHLKHRRLVLAVRGFGRIEGKHRARGAHSRTHFERRHRRIVSHNGERCLGRVALIFTVHHLHFHHINSRVQIPMFRDFFDIKIRVPHPISIIVPSHLQQIGGIFFIRGSAGIKRECGVGGAQTFIRESVVRCHGEPRLRR